MKDYKVCQKIGKYVTKPKITLPKATSFYKIITLDLEKMGNKYTFWAICIFEDS